MNMRRRGTDVECRQATGTTDGNRRNTPSPAHQNRPGACGRDLGWRPATAADPAGGTAAGSVRRRTREPERSPLTDREVEP